MIIRNELTTTAAKRLLRLVDSLLIVTNDTLIDPYATPEYKALNKHRKKLAKQNKKYPQYANIDSAAYLREFCIPFSYMPDEMFNFMVTIEWIDGDTCQPYNANGFYSSIYHGFGEHSRDLITEWYIDIDRYIELCLCYSRLKEKFTSPAA